MLPPLSRTPRTVCSARATVAWGLFLFELSPAIYSKEHQLTAIWCREDSYLAGGNPTFMDLLAPEFRADPYPRYAELRRERPVAQIESLGVWVVSRCDDVLSVLKSPQYFSSDFCEAWEPGWVGHNPLAHSLITMDPASHARLGSVLRRAFNSSIKTPLGPRLRSFIAALTEGLAGQSKADFIESFAKPLSVFVLGELIGLDASFRPHLRRWADDVASISPMPRSIEHALRVRSSLAELSRHIHELILDRRRAPREDLVSALMQDKVAGQSLSTEQIVSFVVLLLVAGLETSAHLLANTMLLLAKRPEELARLRETPSLVPLFIEELIRYEPPVHGVPRLTTAEVIISGVTLPPHSLVLALIGSANHDEQHYPDPERFDIYRKQPALSFGHGVHYCLGSQLIRQEMRLALEVLIGRFRGLALNGPVEWNSSLTLRGPVTMPLDYDVA